MDMPQLSMQQPIRKRQINVVQLFSALVFNSLIFYSRFSDGVQNLQAIRYNDDTAHKYKIYVTPTL